MMSASRPMILIVDDHSDLRDALMLLFEDEGFHVVDSSNGAEALDYLRSGKSVNALIVDLDMPVMGEWEFLAARREHHQWRTMAGDADASRARCPRSDPGDFSPDGRWCGPYVGGA